MTELELLRSIVCILALLLALNLKLTLLLYKKVKQLPGFVPIADPLQDGSLMPVLNGTNLFSAQAAPVWRQGYATAILLFASRCAKCKTKLAEVPALLTLADGHGLDIRLISNEPARLVRRFLADDSLASHCVLLPQQDYLLINPQQMSPAYVFIDQQGQVEASGLIGDENWLQFCEQLHSIADSKRSVA